MVLRLVHAMCVASRHCCAAALTSCGGHAVVWTPESYRPLCASGLLSRCLCYTGAHLRKGGLVRSVL